jgi:hypothetical protein
MFLGKIKRGWHATGDEPLTPTFEYPQGITLRQWYAGHAMELAREDYGSFITERDLRAWFGGRAGLSREEIVAHAAFRYADAMIAEGKK